MKRIVLVMAGVFLFGAAAIAQNRAGQCATRLNGLTSEQTTKVNQLVNDYQQAMATLRTERRSTADLTEKDNVRRKMLDQQDAYRNRMKEVLTAEQWAQYQSLYQAGYGNGQGRYAAGNRGGKQGRGNGQATFNRGRGGQPAGRCFRTNI